jgi:hypothetical protein
VAAKKKSITFTALIWFGMLLAAAGAAVAILGIGGAVEFSAKVGSTELKTTSVGLAICAIGCLLAGGVATRLPKDVAVLATRKPTFIDWISQYAWWVLGLALVAVVLFLLSLR